MQAQFFLRMALIILIAKYANAETRQERRDLNFQIEIDNKVYENRISEYDILEIIKSLGINVDENSEIYVHEEDNYIDLGCFNCIINPISINEEIQHSHNWRVEK